MRPGLIPARGVVRQARGDAATLGVTMVVVAIAAFLATALPRASELVATDEVRESIESAGAASDVVIAVPLRGSQGEGYELNLYTAQDAEYVRGILVDGMPAAIAGVMGAPVTVIESPEVKAGVIAGLPGRARFTYVASEAGPALEWVDGRAPVVTGAPDDLLDLDGGFLPIEVALSEQTAALMEVGVGDQLAIENPDGVPLEVWVAGIFRPADPADPAWRVEPQVIEPRIATGAAGRANVSLLVTAESVPFARFAMFPGTMSRTYTFAARPEAFEGASADEVATEVRGLAAGKQVFPLTGGEPAVATRLDRVLDDAIARVAAGGAQAAVLLIGVLAVAALVELVAGSVLMERRASVIRQWRSRGATLAAVGAALAVESVAVAALGGGVGIAAAVALVPGDVPVAWMVPPLLTAAMASPLLGIVTAARLRARRGASRRLGALTPQRVRRLAAESLLVALALAAVVALRARGTSGSAGIVAADLPVLAAPVLVAVAVAVVSLRLAGPLARAARRAAARSRGIVALLAAARSRPSALPTIAVAVAVALGTFAVTATQTVSQGQVDAAWDVVGADASAHADPGRQLPDEVADLAARQELTVATAAILPSSQLIGPRVDESARVVVIDAAAMATLLDASGRADGGPLRALAERSASRTGDEALPILVSGAPASLDGVSLRWEGAAVPVTRVGGGVALPIDEARGLTVIVDRAAFESAFGGAAGITDAWAAGADALAQLSATVGDAKATVTGRQAWLDAARAAPVASALGVLFVGAGALAGLLAALAVALLAASGAWDRARAVAGLRVIGTRRGPAERVAWLEVAVPVALASALGTIVGMGISLALTGALGLASLTGQQGPPRVIVPWLVVLVPAALAVVARCAVWLAARSHGRERLGPLMRVG